MKIKFEFGCHSIDNSLFVSTRKGKKNILSQLMLFVLSVDHMIFVKNGAYSRKLIFLTIGGQIVLFRNINVINVAM